MIQFTPAEARILVAVARLGQRATLHNVARAVYGEVSERSKATVRQHICSINEKAGDERAISHTRTVVYTLSGPVSELFEREQARRQGAA